MATQQNKKDHWSAEAYKNAADFVPKLATKVVEYLNAQPNDNILDIGCGDGPLTAQIAASLSGSTGQILGLDASQSFIASAKSRHSSQKCTFELQDCTQLGQHHAINGQWDKVFSNAALHWILRNPSTRTQVLRDVYKALKPGGKFVFEMGGKGNVAEVHAALIAALLAHDVSLEQARAVSPWFFPSADWMRSALTEVGFDVEICELEYRPTKTTSGSGAQGAGLEGWVRLMGAQFLEAVEQSKVESVVRYVCDVLETIVTREEDGSRWIGYTRLRAVASKR